MASFSAISGRDLFLSKSFKLTGKSWCFGDIYTFALSIKVGSFSANDSQIISHCVQKLHICCSKSLSKNQNLVVKMWEFSKYALQSSLFKLCIFVIIVIKFISFSCWHGKHIGSKCHFPSKSLISRVFLDKTIRETARKSKQEKSQW